MSNTTQPAQSAAAQVFATTELLEQILLSFDDLKSLTAMRRVAPQWRAVIDETSSLKKKMWLVPQQLDHEWYLSPGATHLRKRPRATDAAAATADGEIIYKSATPNPLLFLQHCRRPIWASSYHVSWVSQPLFIQEQAKPSLLRTRGIFLKMFATQPPVPVMYLRVLNGDDLSNYSCLVEKIKNSKGVKVRDVLRALSRMPKSREMMVVVEEVMFPRDDASDFEAEPWHGFLYHE